MSDSCPICTTQLSSKNYMPEGRDVTVYSCPLCGDFALSGTLVACIKNIIEENDNSIPKISHAIRTMQEINKGAELYSNTIEEILKRPLPSPKEQADLLLRWIANNVSGPGETIWVEPSTHSSLIGAKSPEGFALVLNHLIDSGLVIGDTTETLGPPGRADVTPSFDGWEYNEQLIHGHGTYRKAFMAMKFGDSILDNILEEIFKPCVLQTGFELNKLDDLPKAGLIDDRLRVEIQSSDFIIADLTHENLGAYWEAGYAEGLGKPVIYTCEKEKFENDQTHFDTNHHLTIVWDKSSPESAGERLKATIRATLPHLAKQQDE